MFGFDDRQMSGIHGGGGGVHQHIVMLEDDGNDQYHLGDAEPYESFSH